MIGLDDVELSPPGFVFAAQMADLGLDIRSYREPLKRAIQQVVAPSLQKNFDVGGRPPWEPLAEITHDIKARMGFELSPLVRTRLLHKVAGQLNLWNITTEHAEATLSNAQKGRAEYGGFHQEGTKFMTARPWAVIQPEDEDEIEQIFWGWIAERMARHGFRPGGEALAGAVT